MTLHFYWTYFETQKGPIIDMNSHFLSGVYCAGEMEDGTPGKNPALS